MAVSLPRRAEFARLAPLGVVTGIVSALNPAAALAIMGVGLLTIATVLIPVVWGVIAVAGTLAPWRLGGDAGPISYSDLSLGAATVVAIFHGGLLSSRHVRLAVMAAAVYLSATVPALISNPSLVAVTEWGHRGMLTIGAILVGAWIARCGGTVVALKSYIGLGLVLAAAAAIASLANGLAPAYPLGLQKNFAGSLLATAIILTIWFRPRGRVGISAVVVTEAVLAVGLLATQSRGAIVGMIAGLFVLFLSRRQWRLVGLVVVGGAVGLTVIVSSVNAEILVNPIFGSLSTRLAVAQASIDAWQSSIYLGRGIRFFPLDTTGIAALAGGVADAHDVLLLVLAESGLIGLAGFLVWIAGTLACLHQRKTELALTAVALCVARVAHGTLDVFWVHGSLSIVWIVVGMACQGGNHAAQRAIALGTRQGPN